MRESVAARGCTASRFYSGPEASPLPVRQSGKRIRRPPGVRLANFAYSRVRPELDVFLYENPIPDCMQVDLLVRSCDLSLRQRERDP